MKKDKILVVEDEEDILELVRYNLTKDGYSVTGVASGEDAISFARNEAPKLVILDLMLPGLDGLEVCKVIKSDPKTRHIAIIMLTAKGSEADVVTGLELGADDYIVKPFSPRVLSARVKAVLRRDLTIEGDKSATVRIDELVINPSRHEVKISERLIDLTSTEFKLLHFLARQRGLVFSRYQIVDAVHGEDYPVTDRSVDVQIVGLRKKLGDYGEYIETVRGVGYRFRG
ncbi:MAG: response regulator [Deltaproteobacteria bacterium]|nr:response regulator [Deltaproteobacteria bacterium]